MPTGISLPSVDPGQFARWLDLDFLRSPVTGRIIAAVVPLAQNGTHGRLRVYRYDDADPPNAAGEQELETEGVRQAALAVTSAGRVELIYPFRQGASNWDLRRRYSDDDGVTWSAPEAVIAGATSIGSDDLPTLFRGCHAVYQPQLRLLLVRFAGGGAAANNWVVGEANGSGGWAWSAVQAFLPGSTRSFQALPDGSATMIYQRLYDRIRSNGTHRVKSSTYHASLAVPSTEQFGPWGIDPGRGILVAWIARITSTDPLTWERKWTHSVSRINAAGTQWAGQSSVGGQVELAAHIASGNLSAPRGQPAAALRRRADGVWEFMYAKATGEVVIARCRDCSHNVVRQWSET